MVIISLNEYPHLIEAQSGRTECWVSGYVSVPPEIEADVWESGGYCDLIIEDGVLVGITPREKPVPPPAPPTTEERISALEDALCEKDAADAQRMADIETALCELDTNGGM